ncbi:MAG: transglutaminase-like domain-containing protein [Thermoanaerobaculaceae bacterium]
MFWLAPFLIAAMALADQLQVLLPVPLAARVVAGPFWNGAVVIEPFAGGKVLVTVEASLPLGLPATRPSQYAAGPSFAPCALSDFCQMFMRLPLPWELTEVKGLSPWEKLVAVSSWVSRNVRQNEHDDFPQDAASVLRRREGRCSGRANLAVALLRQLGVPARVAHGLLFSSTRASWHRWGEAWMPEVGWVPFDPGVAVGVVGVRYLPMTGAGERLPLSGITILRLQEDEFPHLPKRFGMKLPGTLAGWKGSTAWEDRL